MSSLDELMDAMSPTASSALDLSQARPTPSARACLERPASPWAGPRSGPDRAAASGAAVTETLIVSDLHLGLPASRPRELLQILESWRFERLILLGDIFHDLSFKELDEDGWRLLRFLRDLSRRQKSEVVLVHGNHDRELGGAVGNLLGIEGRERYQWTSAGRRCVAVHGDCFDDFITNYRRISRFVSTCYGIAQRRLSRRGEWVERFDRFHNRLARLGETIARRAIEHAKHERLDLLVCGHTHEPILRRFEQVDAGSMGAGAYINTGAWVRRPASFVTIDSGGAALHPVP